MNAVIHNTFPRRRRINTPIKSIRPAPPFKAKNNWFSTNAIPAAKLLGILVLGLTLLAGCAKLIH